MIRLGNKQIGANIYGLNSNFSIIACKGTDYFVKKTMEEKYGGYYGYFIAEQDGVLEFEINDSDASDNSGSFDIDIVKMSKKQHEERNYCNTCPINIPIKITDGVFKDSQGNEWTEEDGENVSTVGSSACFHGGNFMLRRTVVIGPDIFNYQCGYDKQGKLVNNNNNMGTFDFGKPKSYEHVIMDVFTHEAFSQKSYTYKPTCKVY